MSKRINVMISDTLNSKLENYSERYGISKSGIVSFVLGQWIDQSEKVNSTVYGTTGDNGMLGELFRSILSEGNIQK